MLISPFCISIHSDGQYRKCFMQAITIHYHNFQLSNIGLCSKPVTVRFPELSLIITFALPVGANVLKCNSDFVCYFVYFCVWLSPFGLVFTHLECGNQIHFAPMIKASKMCGSTEIDAYVLTNDHTAEYSDGGHPNIRMEY